MEMAFEIYLKEKNISKFQVKRSFKIKGTKTVFMYWIVHFSTTKSLFSLKPSGTLGYTLRYILAKFMKQAT